MEKTRLWYSRKTTYSLIVCENRLARMELSFLTHQKLLYLVFYRKTQRNWILQKRLQNLSFKLDIAVVKFPKVFLEACSENVGNFVGNFRGKVHF